LPKRIFSGAYIYAFIGILNRYIALPVIAVRPFRYFGRESIGGYFRLTCAGRAGGFAPQVTGRASRGGNRWLCDGVAVGCWLTGYQVRRTAAGRRVFLERGLRISGGGAMAGVWPFARRTEYA
jgi:hypothetical protein